MRHRQRLKSDSAGVSGCLVDRYSVCIYVVKLGVHICIFYGRYWVGMVHEAVADRLSRSAKTTDLNGELSFE